MSPKFVEIEALRDIWRVLGFSTNDAVSLRQRLGVELCCVRGFTGLLY